MSQRMPRARGQPWKVIVVEANCVHRWVMFKRLLLVPLASIIGIAATVNAAPSASTEKEYQQVRKIALRDLKVQDAYREADRKLEAKMLKIDPALESYMRTRRTGNAAAAVSKPATTPAKSTGNPSPAKAAGPKKSHTVAAGETLGSIAAKHGVSVPALKAANQIKDERKLRIGLVLAIPGGKKIEPAKEKSFWDRFKPGA